MHADGFSEEQAADDWLELGKLTMTGAIAMGTNKITGLASATTSGDALAYGQSSASLASLTMTGAISMGNSKITGLGAPTTGADATTKTYVDGLVNGTPWQSVQVREVIDDSLNDAPGGESAGDAYIVGSAPTGGWSGSGFTTGDLVEYDGAAWQEIVSGTGSAPATGLKVAITDGTPAGSFAGQDGDIATYNAGWTFLDAADGKAIIVHGDGSVEENFKFVFDTSTTTWVLFADSSYTGGNGIDITGNEVIVDLSTNSGLLFNSTQLEVKDYYGITLDTNGISVDPATDKGILVDVNGVAVDLHATTPGLEFSTGLLVKADTAKGIQVDAQGVGINLHVTNPGLEFDTNQLRVEAGGSNGIVLGTTGVEIKIDDTPDTLDVDVDGLKVVGVPLNFKINDTATGNEVTADNLTILTDGSSTSLHSHAGAGAAESIRLTVVAGETVAKMDPVYWDTTNSEFGKADAGTDAKAYVFGIAHANITAAAGGVIVSYGKADGILDGGGTAGQRYYLQDNGGMGTSLPGAAKRIVLIGWAMNTNDFWVQPIDFGKKAA